MEHEGDALRRDRPAGPRGRRGCGRRPALLHLGQRGNRRGLRHARGRQHAPARRLPHLLAGRPEHVHRVEPPGWEGRPRHLGRDQGVDDFCPTPVRRNGLFFVSRRTIAGVTCGMGDIYFTRRNPIHGWSEPQHLGCSPNGPNTAADEMGPSYFEADGKGFLYFSSGPDIFASEQLASGGFGPGSAVASLNSAAADIQPNVRKDGREVVFASNRPGTLGSQDIWAATRESVDNPWSTPVNLGPAINTSDSETRPSLSWDARTLLFGRAPAAGPPGDVYVSTREKVGG